MKLLSLIFLFSASLFFSQTNRFIYELNYKVNPGEPQYKKSFMVVDINPENTKYYDYKFLEKDSLNKFHNSRDRSWTSQIPVTREKKSDIFINYVAVGDDIYTYPTSNHIVWKLENDMKILKDFKAQKATADFGGRQWIAWFTKDIPLSEGPYKFHGLPGLILEIKDTKEQYIFNLVKSSNLKSTYDTSNFLEVRYGEKPIPATEKNVVKKALEYFNDPLNDIRKEYINNKISSFEYNGIKYKPEELTKLVAEEQEDILSTYNPIELDKAFPYPKKAK
ncbi:GLPGLI family protein [Chryseobacterium sp. Leaf201]|uniref:GLPGLI family protein n=1 Tax=Chryseobacterium sp. Leaf201 TaxID=1735672 RepID=UPI0006F8473A|nr:GLPGLI family protein [Chryseobacterium sp. Leaf201]KQM24966.1 hypothetical protein ASE55_17630 [Chryseobacterium sp. Leaf201]